MNPQRIISALFSHRQRLKRCKAAVSSDSDLRTKIIRLVKGREAFCEEKIYIVLSDNYVSANLREQIL